MERLMRAQVLTAAGHPLAAAELPTPRPGPQELLIVVRACAVCRTDLHVVDGELPDPKLPLVPGHEIIGTVVEKGESADRFRVGDRVGVPWLGWTCGVCEYCRSGRVSKLAAGGIAQCNWVNRPSFALRRQHSGDRC